MGHFSTITRHKMEVFSLMRKVGLARQGLLHDLSKYSPTEFLPGVRYFQGTRSPNAAEREDKGYSEAWLHHKGRNKHHFEYWIDVIGPASLKGLDGKALREANGVVFMGAPMPTRYVVEMFCDRIAASKVYLGKDYRDSSPLEYYHREMGEARFVIHPDTERLLRDLLERLAREGEEATLAYVRENIVRKRYRTGSNTRF